MTFSPDRAYHLVDQVALRPEPFGALAYHYGTRRLNFLNSPDLRRVVECINDHPSVNSALESCGINEQRWPSFVAALASLAASGFLEQAAAVAAAEPAGPVEPAAAVAAAAAAEPAGPVQQAAAVAAATPAEPAEPAAVQSCEMSGEAAA